MDLINWSLNAIDTIFSTRSLGSGEPDCPDGTFAAGYTMDAWERWRIVCLAALSVEDIEDIYLFETMITGLIQNDNRSSRSLRSASERRLVVPSQRGSKSLSRTFSFTIPGWWNNLPTPIRNAGSLSIFKQQLKTHLFRHYLTS